MFYYLQPFAWLATPSKMECTSTQLTMEEGMKGEGGNQEEKARIKNRL